MPTEVRKFLMEFKQAVTRGSGVYLVPRKDTVVTLQYLGLTKRNLEELLLSISVNDYCSGPEIDRDQDGEIWVFGKRVRGYDVYIKLKVARIGEKTIAKCISFHIAKYPLSFPYKKS